MKTENELFAPQIDSVVSNLRPEWGLMCGRIYGNLKEIYKLFSCVKPIGDDDVRQIWMEVERGPLEAFGDYDENKQCGEVETQEDFEQLWRAYYPEKTKWYQFQTAKYKDDLYFYIDRKLIFSIDIKKENSDSKPGWNLEPFQQFTDWLLERINDETEKLRKDVASYNLYIQQNLPFTAFSEWFHSGRVQGAHPWEICRGGNSTHISLFVSHKNGHWDIRLAGSSNSITPPLHTWGAKKIALSWESNPQTF